MKLVYQKIIEFKEGVSPVVLELARAGRSKPEHGVRVIASIYLPADSLGELHPTVRHASVAINWMYLTPNWGDTCNLGSQQYRYTRHVIIADTWAEAERSAMEWLYITILPLLVDLAGRSPIVARGIYRANPYQSIWVAF